MERKRRSPLIATLLSIITPGLGQVYNGQIKKGVIFIVIILFLQNPIYMSGIQFKFYGILFILGLVLFVWLYAIGDALIIAIKKKEIILRSYNRWYFYLLFVILIATVSLITDALLKTGPLGSRIESYKIPSGAMIPTLLIDDHIIANIDRNEIHDIKRGDIVIFKYPLNPEKDFIKWVIATEGDVIEGRNKVVYINGKVVKEPYTQHSDKNIMLNSGVEMNPRDNFGPITIPEGKLFVMVDNRDASYDSRFWGFVDRNDIKGKALYIYWSKDKSRIGQEIK